MWSHRRSSHGLLVRRHGVFIRLRCVLRQGPARERAATLGRCLDNVVRWHRLPLCLQPTYQCPACDPLLHSAARSTGAITCIEAEAPGASSVACGSMLAESVLFRGLLRVAGRRPGAARRRFRRHRRRRRRSCAAATTRPPGRAARAAPAAMAAARCPPPTTPRVLTLCSGMKKKCRGDDVFSRAVCTSVCVPCAFLTLLTPLYTRVCVV